MMPAGSRGLPRHPPIYPYVLETKRVFCACLLQAKWHMPLPYVSTHHESCIARHTLHPPLGLGQLELESPSADRSSCMALGCLWWLTGCRAHSDVVITQLHACWPLLLCCVVRYSYVCACCTTILLLLPCMMHERKTDKQTERSWGVK
jgi:hypothetical protein